jgi:adenine phosphoribosyltransferase
MDELKNDIKNHIRKVPDFPEPGILFYDLFEIFVDPTATNMLISLLEERVRDLDIKYIAALDSRGFLPGLLLAGRLHKGFIPIRKAGKLPPPTLKSEPFKLEYATAQVEISTNTIKKGDKVLLIDDVLATGNTLNAGAKLLQDAGADIQLLVCLLEIEGLNGKDRFNDIDLWTVFKDSEL